jgi:hypothetical protein
VWRDVAVEEEAHNQRARQRFRHHASASFLLSVCGIFGQ